MAKNVEKELHELHVALTDQSNEDAKRPKVYPFFKALFPDKFKVESEAEGSDIYITGKLLVELKGNDWLAGFYQAQHYLKKGLSFKYICVLQNEFLAMWRLDDKSIPDEARLFAKKADAHTAPNIIGKRNAKLTSKSLRHGILKACSFLYQPQKESLFGKETRLLLHEWLQQLNNLDAARLQIRPDNFIEAVERLEKFFPTKMEAVHAFYSIVGSWDPTSRVTRIDDDNLSVTSFATRRQSDKIRIARHKQDAFIKFVEERYIFTNEGSGLTPDYYFGRFDEVISRLDPEYAKQHGIFFTDINLSKFAIWFVHNYYENKLGDKYIVLDPAGGSGNLATSWKGHLKHKIVSELQPDLLKTIEKRMKYDPDEVQHGYTIIPKTSENVGLNFLDKSAEAYYEELKKALRENNVSMDKPIAFLLNPPYKNNDQNEGELKERDAAYVIDPKILELTGEDAGKERYLAFLGQILRIAQLSATEQTSGSPLVMIFTPTSWLIPRPTYQNFRAEWDKYFKYERGFLITSNEFFEVPGKWPLAFTVWRYNHAPKGNKNVIDPRDYTFLVRKDLDIDWTAGITNIDQQLHHLVDRVKGIRLNIEFHTDIRETLPPVNGSKGRQPRLNTYRNSTPAMLLNRKKEGGFALGDEHHWKRADIYGYSDGEFIGLMDDNSLVRLRQDPYARLSKYPDRIWFRLDNVFINVNQTRLLSGPADKYGYCAYDLETARATLSWFAITKAVNGKYPIWANQFDIWSPNVIAKLAGPFYGLCFAFGLFESRCIVTKFEANNPVHGAPEIFLDNPLSPNNPESFLMTTLAPAIESSGSQMAKSQLANIKELYRVWNLNYCKGKTMEEVGLEDEPYFKYFSYPDFVTPNSGIVQIKKYASKNNALDLINMLDDISSNSKTIKDEIYRMLVEDFKYFE